MAPTGKPKVSTVKSASKAPIKATKVPPKKSKPETISDSVSESNEDDSDPSLRRKCAQRMEVTQLLNDNHYAVLKDADPEVPENSNRIVEATKYKLMKPIIIENTNIEIIQNFIASTKTTQKLLYKKNPNNSFQINCGSFDDKQVVIQKLKQQNFEYFTYSQNEERNLVFVLKNHYFVELDLMKNILEAEGLPTIKVTFLNKNSENPMYLIHFKKDFITLPTLSKNFSNIQNLIVKWEKLLKSKKKTTQCYNCQCYGHSSSNCGKQQRCVKCTKSHAKGDCARTSKEGNPECVNCNKDHAANSKLCEFYLKYKEKISKFKKSEKPREFTTTPAPWAPLKSFNNFPNLNNKPQQPAMNFGELQQVKDTPSVSFSNLQSEFNEIPEISITLQLYADLIKKLKSTNDHKVRIQFMMQFSNI